MTWLEILALWIIPFIRSAFIFYILADSVIRIGCNRKIGRRKRFGGFLLYSILSFTISVFCQSSILNLLAIVVLLPVFAHYLCNSQKNYFLYYILISLVSYLTDMICLFTTQWLIMNGALYFIRPEYYNILHCLVSVMVMLAAVRAAVYLIRKREKHDLARSYYFAGMILPVFSCVYLFTLLYFMQVYIDNNYIILYLINILLILGLNIYFIKVMEVTEKNHYLNNELNLSQQQGQLQLQYYEDLKRRYQESRQVIHDIRNHIQALEQLHEASADEQALIYTKDIHSMLNHLSQNYYTSGRVLNLIINDKVRLMRELDIRDDIRIGDVAWEVIKDIDITILFGNLFDNAIEAASQSPDKWILLRADVMQDFISIIFSNSTDKAPTQTEDGFISSKEGNHQGIGLKNVERTVKKYGGDIQYDYADKQFHVKLLLPL